MGTSNDQYLSGDEMTEIIEHEGKQFRRVQIEGQDGDHLMDEDANIYTLDFEKIGCGCEWHRYSLRSQALHGFLGVEQ